ncbi:MULTISPECIES: hypothetical protein [unclassified Novosphingobium]|uniref:hypothetical protein n=1 Tax=Novosphingobium TaxID=165696 RepID=UPI001447C49F|nr:MULTISPECIES: hypothetical protein [unclassified Novosphingobium]NKJ43253.1 hypothetical protein [Novosphingobium sp. SG720]NMN07053.1 hypothetical protein [Novosphingobium sp. SG919]NMN89359.1 hypothetical protein [Novosphingobium sp. SG916]
MFKTVPKLQQTMVYETETSLSRTIWRFLPHRHAGSGYGLSVPCALRNGRSPGKGLSGQPVLVNGSPTLPSAGQPFYFAARKILQVRGMTNCRNAANFMSCPLGKTRGNRA